VVGRQPPLTRHDGKWELLPNARPCIDQIRATMTPEDYEQDKHALQDFLCNYFNTGNCDHKQGKSVSPMKSTFTEEGGKCLKVRWGLPGCGKSGGLRLAVVVYCKLRRVKIAGAWLRPSDPSDQDFEDAVRGV